MSAPSYEYFIRSRWSGRVETASDVGIKFLKTLDVLSSIDPIFAEWTMTDMRNLSSLSLQKARPRITDVIEDNIARDDFDEPSPDYGYSACARAGRFKDPRSANFRLEAGGSISNGTKLEFAEYNVAPDLTVVTYPIFKAVLLAINEIWCAPWACAQVFRSDYDESLTDLGGVQATRIESVMQVPTDLAFPGSIFHIPWIGYLSAELASGLKLAPEILIEHTSDGGLLMSATTERFDPTNPEHLRRARVIAEALIACTDRSLR